jgi:uncharacterized protein (DUF2384 family)
MSDQEQQAEQPSTDKQPVKRFRNRFAEKRLSADGAERQGRVTKLAWEKLGGTAGAVDFLNNHDDALGGRPLDIAVASAAGLEAVEQAIAARASNQG